MNAIQSDTYQRFLKTKTIDDYRLLSKDSTHLFTQMDLSALFYCMATDFYLKKRGVIGFLLKGSFLAAAKQLDPFREFSTPKMRLSLVLDFEHISGDIFSLPVCALIARKGWETKYPVKMLEFEGEILPSERNADLSSLVTPLTITESKWSPPVIPEGESPYHELFRVGASLYPRVFWFIDFTPSALGSGGSEPKVESSKKAIQYSRGAWTRVRLAGNIEERFIFSTVLGKDLAPFAVTAFRPVFLPAISIRQKKGPRIKYRLLAEDNLDGMGYPKAGSWVRRCQQYWNQKARPRSRKRMPHVIDRLDYNGGLTGMEFGKRYLVLYNARGADSYTAFVDRLKIPTFVIDGASYKPTAFVPDYTVAMFETDSRMEAFYLVAVLNAPSIHQAVKPFQPKGKYGHRDIGLRPFRLDIPLYDDSNPKHERLVKIADQAATLVEQALSSSPKMSWKKKRNLAIKATRKKLREIDKIVVDSKMNRPLI